MRPIPPPHLKVKNSKEYRWYLKGGEKLLRYQREWNRLRREHRDYVRKYLRRSSFARRYRDRLHREHPFCYICNAYIPYGSQTIDHVLARVLGGRNNPENLKLACSPCNGEKGKTEHRPQLAPQMIKLAALIKTHFNLPKKQ